jgi:acetyl esterase/lipase
LLAVGYYGVGIEKALALAPRITCPLVLQFAADDKFVPAAAREQISAAFAGRQNVEIHVYPGVDHAFARPGGHAFNKPAALMAHSRAIPASRRETAGGHGWELGQANDRADESGTHKIRTPRSSDRWHPARPRSELGGGLSA